MPKKTVKKTPAKTVRKARREGRPTKKPQSGLRVSRDEITIRFASEPELRKQLQALLSMFGDDAVAATLGVEGIAAAPAAAPCLSLIASAQVVAAALAPKPFNPTEKLGETYLTQQERELFRARVVDNVLRKSLKKCRIDAGSVLASAGTTHGDVTRAVHENAHA